MGKKGDLLRAAKKKSVTYTFTKEELEARDKQLLLEHTQRLHDKMTAVVDQQWKQKEKNAKEIIRQEWDERMKLFNSNDAASNMIEFTRLAMMIPFKALVQYFGWNPARPGKAGVPDGRYAITKLHDICALELNGIAQDEDKDIRNYAKEAEKITGIDFRLGE